ncbi:MAG TPA: hypothetical protein VD816_10355 [Ohtaekwangia sp.]|nr:hypothetical protein [Ohtaekwangia sp.]
MTPHRSWLLLLCLVFSFIAQAQVDEIKRKSSEYSGKKGSGSSSDGGGSGGSEFYIELVAHSINGLVNVQQHTLKKKATNPTIISLDVFLQTAIQPSGYYIIHPRIRGNWGLFSTDFRFNYLIEEDPDGVKYLRTDDWQIIQLNLLTLKNFTFRLGAGVIHEQYSGGKTFTEWTAGLHVNSNRLHIGAMTEYRWSIPRDEWSGQVQYRILQAGKMNWYATGGIVFQRYYEAINVWGMQAGIMLKVF